MQLGLLLKCLCHLSWIMVALFVALVACPPPFSVLSIGYGFLYGGCRLVLNVDYAAVWLWVVWHFLVLYSPPFVCTLLFWALCPLQVL
ncbi:hypothetical protein ACE6H2_003693 [Prunus campanulata]